MADDNEKNKIRKDIINTFEKEGTDIDNSLLLYLELMERDILEMSNDVKELKFELLALKVDIAQLKAMSDDLRDILEGSADDEFEYEELSPNA